ncbi:hypothetical protein, partial [Acinetobacter baumannii]|uniref:hypothetical protein n=1 Tax=Acinetobacter baumannii TaxID=470 RepID=UPI0019CF8015
FFSHGSTSKHGFGFPASKRSTFLTLPLVFISMISEYFVRPEYSVFGNSSFLIHLYIDLGLKLIHAATV